MSGLSLVSVALALVVGEGLGFGTHCMAGMWPWACLCATSLALVWLGWDMACLRWPVAALAGIALSWRCETRRMDVEERSHSPCADGRPPAYELDVEGRVSCRERRSKDGRMVAFNSTMDGVPVRVVIRMGIGGEVPKSGERWRCRGWLSLRQGAPSRYSCRTLWVLGEDGMERIAPATGLAAQAAYRTVSDRMAACAKAGLGWSHELASTNMAMLLGRRGGIGPDRRAAFAAAGTMHVFAISGLHVMLIAGALNALLKKVGFSPLMQAALCIPLLAAYVMLTGARASAIRAALMMSLWFGAGLFGRKPDSLAALGVTGIIVYAHSPTMVFDAGCGLSFAVMLGILLWLRWSSRFALPFCRVFEWAAEERSLGAEGRLGALLCRWRGHTMWVLGMLGVSLASWIASTPISARVFGRISMGGLVANVAVVPLATMSVLFSAIGVAASVVARPMGAVFNNLAACCTWMMEWVSETVAMCPGASFETHPWSWLDCIVWYVAWIGLFAVVARHLRPRGRMRIAPWDRR